MILLTRASLQKTCHWLSDDLWLSYQQFDGLSYILCDNRLSDNNYRNLTEVSQSVRTVIITKLWYVQWITMQKSVHSLYGVNSHVEWMDCHSDSKYLSKWQILCPSIECMESIGANFSIMRCISSHMRCSMLSAVNVDVSAQHIHILLEHSIPRHIVIHNIYSFSGAQTPGSSDPPNWRRSKFRIS